MPAPTVSVSPPGTVNSAADTSNSTVRASNADSLLTVNVRDSTPKPTLEAPKSRSETRLDAASCAAKPVPDSPTAPTVLSGSFTPRSVRIPVCTPL